MTGSPKPTNPGFAGRYLPLNISLHSTPCTLPTQLPYERATLQQVRINQLVVFMCKKTEVST